MTIMRIDCMHEWWQNCIGRDGGWVREALGNWDMENGKKEDS